jgi:penicillin-binding protein 1C
MESKRAVEMQQTLASPPATKTSLRMRVARRLLAGVALVSLALFITHSLFHEALIDDARFVIPPDALSITDHEGAPLRHARGRGADRRWVSLEHIDQDLIDCVVAVEDQRFYSHDGVDARATSRALLDDLIPGGRHSGASTITQQLVKLVYGRAHGPSAYVAKAFEILRARELETRMSKDEILEQYLNRLPYGHGIEGIERAAQAYFGHPASDLTLGEAALLAGLPQAPSRLDPRRHLDRALQRRNTVLARLAAQGTRSAAELDAARHEAPRILDASPRAYRAPRFVDHVLTDVREGRIESQHGSVSTSLDLTLQTHAEAELSATLARFRSRGATNAAGVVVLNATGEIRAYVGAADVHGEGGALDLLRVHRQPGSTLKPFVYAAFFEQGGGPASIVDDIRTAMTGHAGALYSADNYDGHQRGPIPARLALAGSLNLAALDVSRRVGQERVLRELRAFGLASGHQADDVGAAVVLGGADVTALELTAAYMTLARRGTRIPLRATALLGEPLEPSRAVPEEAAMLVREVLADRDARRAGFGRDLAELAGEGEVALKTGTSQGWRDAWCAVFDEDFTVVVWLGDPSGDPMRQVSGFDAAAPAAMRILRRARERRDELVPASAPAAHGTESALVHAHVCTQTGLRPGPHCHHVAQESFAPGAVPTRTCDAHDEDGTLLLAPRYATWLNEATPLGMRIGSNHAIATPTVSVTYPEDGAILLMPLHGDTAIPLRASLTEGVRFEVDGVQLPEGGLFHLREGAHRVVAVAANLRSAPSVFEVRRQ